MSSSICLIRCPSPFLIDEKMFPPLGLMAVGTTLHDSGHNVLIYDGSIEGIPGGFGYYGFGPTIPEYGYALDAKKFIKSNYSDAKVILGGPYATLVPEKCLKDGFDSVVVGDGELAVLKSVNNGGGIIKAEEKSLDSYPIINRNILDLDNYRYLLNGKPTTTMLTSQGCPYRCAFCCKTYKTVRFKSIVRVMREIDYLYFDCGFQALAFPEDLFIISKKRTEAICNHLKRRNIIWRCLIRADLFVKYGKKFAKRMADSGCVEVGMGIESGSDTILKIVNKSETVGTIRKAIEMLKNAGIRVKGYFIVGLPGENQKTLNETRKLLDDAKLDDIDVKIYQPYPGSAIWENKQDYDISWDDNLSYEVQYYKGRFGEYHGNVRTSALTTDQIYKEWLDMERTYKHAS